MQGPWVEHGSPSVVIDGVLHPPEIAAPASTLIGVDGMMLNRDSGVDSIEAWGGIK